MHSELRRFKAEFFKALGHPARIEIVDGLRAGEKAVGEIQGLISDPASASQHLALLRGKGIVIGRKSGTTVFYRVRDPKVFDLLDVAKAMFNAQLLDTQQMLSELAEEERPAEPVSQV